MAVPDARPDTATGSVALGSFVTQAIGRAVLGALALMLFGALSIVSTIVWHAAYKKNGGPSPDSDLNQRARRYLGRRAVVAEAFRNGRGSILLDDTRWQALSEGGGDLDPGAAVEIVGADGATLRVRAA